MKLHKSITTDKLMEAIQRRDETIDNPGFCIHCGSEQNGCEPNAMEYKCEKCGEFTVWAPEMIFMDFEGFL